MKNKLPLIGASLTALSVGMIFFANILAVMIVVFLISLMFMLLVKVDTEASQLEGSAWYPIELEKEARSYK